MTLFKGQPKKRKYIRISYTNIDVFLSKRLECMDHLERDKPHRVETKLRPNIQVDRSGDGNYGVWRKDRMKKGGGGMIVLTRKDLTVKNVSLEGDGEEVADLVVTDGRQDNISIGTMYVPQKKTSAWGNEQYDDIIRSTIDRMEIEVAINHRVVIVWRYQLQKSHVRRIKSGE